MTKDLLFELFLNQKIYCQRLLQTNTSEDILMFTIVCPMLRISHLLFYSLASIKQRKDNQCISDPKQTRKRFSVHAAVITLLARDTRVFSQLEYFFAFCTYFALSPPSPFPRFQKFIYEEFFITRGTINHDFRSNA